MALGIPPLPTSPALRNVATVTIKRRFAPNIDGKGRLVRALLALGLFIGAGFGFTNSIWLGLALLTAGMFVAFEAVRGWCAVRACGIKTLI